MNKLEKLLGLTRLRGAPDALMRRGVAASVEHRRALHDLGCRTVVDIGANRGQFSLLARALFPAAQIVAFEPLPGPAATFRRVFAGDARVILHPYAISTRSGTAPIHVSARDDSSSLLPIGVEQSRIFPGTGEAALATIEVRRLDDVLRREDVVAPALLKLDVQGFELTALQGCEELLDRFDWVYAECSFIELYEGQALAGEVIAWLRERGLRLAGVYNMAYDREGRAVQGDFLFGR